MKKKKKNNSTVIKADFAETGDEDVLRVKRRFKKSIYRRRY